MDINFRYLKINDIQLHCATSGQQGPLIILLHGFPECWYSWRHQIKVLAQNFRVVAPDLRGYHKSDKPKDVMAYTMPKLLDDVQGLIQEFGEQKAIIVGHDWGGAIAWNFAMERPAWVSKLVVMDCPHPAIFFQKIYKTWRQLLRSWYLLYFQIPWLPEKLLSRNQGKLLRKLFLKLAVQKNAWSELELNYLIAAVSDINTLHAGINYYRAFARIISKTNWLSYKNLNDWPKINAPTLLLWGAQDPVMGKKLTIGMEPLFAASFQIQFVDNCGHWIQQEQPQIVNQHLNDFLKDRLS